MKNAVERIFTCKNRSRYSRKRATFCRNFANRRSLTARGQARGRDDPDYKPDLSVDLPELSATRKASAGPPLPGRWRIDRTKILLLKIFPSSGSSTLRCNFQFALREKNSEARQFRSCMIFHKCLLKINIEYRRSRNKEWEEVTRQCLEELRKL